ncbi:polysaccharide pyruvyl transferase family protein [Pigmentiphaga daeguensis]|uniref:Polysaccharide pyruvyl transferase family protein n=2 Tax=Pigmentiphaga daeguensis TaxID=414049 RepID=A0ABN1D488_9BURK
MLDEQVKTPRRLLAIGSILHFAKDGDVIWGSGVNGKIPESTHQFKKLDVRAVRGPLTRKFLRERSIPVPEVYGDPALLLPILFPSRFQKTKKTRKLAVVPNLHDLNLIQHDESLISPLLPWHQVVDAIVGSELVVSTSLHGLIIAEAFGVPARYLRLSETESLFKFEDYYRGTGRSNIPYARTLQEAIKMDEMPPPAIDYQSLLAAFPIDLWNA